MLLLIDNYDSFTFNLSQYFQELGANVCVFRNDEITLEYAETLKPSALCISPGPCRPSQAGVSVALIQQFAGRLPILGVCLGHQAIGEAFGGVIVPAKTVMHGKTSPVYHQNQGVFHGLPNPLTCARYHSLAIDRDTLPQCLLVTAETRDGEIMGIRHRTLDIEGVQFHPEAILSDRGHDLLNNFLNRTRPVRPT
jgi:anthranilate synthase component 2